MAKKKDAETATEEPVTTVPAEKLTQSDAVAKAIAAGKDSPSEGVAYVKEQFDITLSKGSFSTIKSKLKKASGATPAKRGRAASKPATGPGVVGNGKVAAAVPNMALQIEALKVLCDTLGVDQVISIAQLFRK